MRNILWLVALVVSFAFAGTALATDGAETFKAKCVACHGKAGEGMKGMAPALKGNAFVKGTAADVKKTFLEGRSGAAKKYKEFPIDMPKNPMSDADADALVKFLQGDLQK